MNPRTRFALLLSTHQHGDPRRSGLCRSLTITCALWAFCVGVVPSTAQSFSVLHNFAGYLTKSGAEPRTGLIQGTDGNLYGTTTLGGAGSCTFGCGTVYKITASGAYSVLYSFQSPDGGPSSGLIQASDGKLYGTTAWGGSSSSCYPESGCGSIYQISSDGAFKTLYAFPEAGGPMAGVIQALDGNFYGSTSVGGPSGNCRLGCGTIFQLTPAGDLTTVHTFSGSDGSEPGSLIQATDGNFYGITWTGGSGTSYSFNGNGTIFKITPPGTLTTLYSFCAQSNCGDGGGPSSLVQGSDGNFYGTAVYGGAHGGGTIFKITSAGAFTTVYDFCSQKKNCADGNEPIGLMQASDGNFYGTTIFGGTVKVGGGTVFEIRNGTLTTIHAFPQTGGSYLEGQEPVAGVMEAANGILYGTTSNSGANNNCGNGCGTIFTFGLAAVSLAKSSLKFGNQALDETSTSLPLTLKNTGGTVLAINDVTVTGDFAIATNTCTGAMLLSNQICKVTITFTPASLGLENGTLSFIDSAGNSPQSIPLSGTGVEPATIAPTSVTFAKQAVGTTSSAKTFALHNRQDTTLTNITISTTGDFSVSTKTCVSSLAANQTCTIDVTFTPTHTGTRTGTLTISDNAANTPQVATLTGTGK